MSVVVQTSGGPLPLPQPESFDDWREWARQVNATLEQLQQGQQASQTVNYYNWQNVPASSLPDWPAGFSPVWMDNTSAELFLLNPAYDPPTGGDIVYIDTQAIANAAITTPLVANLAVTTALIGDAAIVNAKIGDLAVNEAKIANLAVTSGKIANLAVGTAHIQDAAVGNAKIGDTISSASWNAMTKAGWLIDKNGNIQGQSLALYDNAGTLIFSAGGEINWARILDVEVEAADLVTGIFTAANISTYIEGAAIGTALIADAAIVRALIADAAIGEAQIEDASITNAKIINLVVDKLLSGTLDATIDVATGILKFTIGAGTLYIGRGFGISNQFFFWYGPALSSPDEASEALATVYIKTDGSAYFGGQLSGSGTGGFRADFSGSADTLDSGALIVTGADRTIIASYSYNGSICGSSLGTMTGGIPTADFVIERWNGATWDTLASDTFSGIGDDYSLIECFLEYLGGNLIFTDTTGGTAVRYRAVASNQHHIGASGTIDTDSRVQSLVLTVLEE